MIVFDVPSMKSSSGVGEFVCSAPRELAVTGAEVDGYGSSAALEPSTIAFTPFMAS